LIHVLGALNGEADVSDAGPLVETRRRLRGEGIDDDLSVRLRPGLRIRRGKTIEVVRVKAASEVHDDSRTSALAEYWEDPVGRRGALGPLYGSPIDCHRFYVEGDPSTPSIKFNDEIDGGLAVYDLLAAGPKRYRELRSTLDPQQLRLLNRLYLAGLVETTGEETRGV
jgi:hypothetical protein